MTDVAVAFPSGGDALRRRLRAVLVALGVLGTAVAVPGLAARYAFSEPTTLKYLVSVAGPLLLVAIAAMPRPQRVLVPLAILVAPFGSLVVTLHGISISLFVVAVLAAVVVTAFDDAAKPGRSATGRSAIIALALLVPGVLIGSQRFHEFELFGSIVVISWLTARLVRDHREGLALVAGTMMLTGTTQSIFAIYEFVTKHQLSFYGGQTQTISSNYFFNYDGVDRAVGTLPDPISLGNVLAVTLPISMAVLVVLLRRRRFGLAIPAVLAMVLMVTGLSLTLSRMSWIGSAVGVLAVAISLGKPWRLRAVATILAVGVVAVFVSVKVGGSALGVRLGSVLDPTSSSVSTAAGDRSREQLWSVTERVFAAHPFVGVGFGHLSGQLAAKLAGVSSTTHSSNTFLQVAAEAGVVGLLGLVALGLGLGRDLLSRRIPRVWAAALAGAFVALMVTWLTDYTIRYVAVAASIAPIFGLVIGLRNRAEPDSAGAIDTTSPTPTLLVDHG